MRWLTLLAILVGGCLAGCNAEIDEKMYRVREDKYTVDTVMTAASRQFLEGAKEMAEKKHGLQARDVQTTWELFIQANTDKAGNVTIPADKLIAAVQRRDEAMQAMNESRKGWDKYVTAYVEALAKYEAVNELVRNEEADVIEAKRSTQAALNAALQALGAAAAGAGVAALAL